jgi:hypothetical protein
MFILCFVAEITLAVGPILKIQQTGKSQREKSHRGISEKGHRNCRREMCRRQKADRAARRRSGADIRT